MNISQFSRLCIMAVMAVFVSTLTGISITPALVAQNMTGGNMTSGGTNMTDTNQTGSISQVAPELEQEGEGEGEADFTVGGNTGSDEEGEGPKIDLGNNQGGNTGSDEEEN
jgi:hypothetical protein